MSIRFVAPPIAGAPGIIIRDPVRRWKARLTERLDLDREWRRESRALLRQYRYGEDQHFTPFINRHRGKMTINLTFSFIRTVMAATSFRIPRIEIKGLTEEDEANAPILGAVLNDALEACDAESAFQMMTLDGLITGEGYQGIGYASKYGFNPRVLDPRRSKKHEVEFDEYITDERVFTRRVSPFNLLIDPMAEGIHDARWVAERFVRPLDVLHNDRRFKAKGQNIATGRPYMGTDDFADEDAFQTAGGRVIDSAIFQAPREGGSLDVPIEYYLVLDKEEKKVFSIQESVDSFFSEKRDWSFDVGGFPYEGFQPFSIPNEQKGMSLTELISWPQYEYNEISRFHIDAVKRQNPKMGVAKGAISPQGIQLIKRGVPGAVVETVGPPRDAMAPVPQLQIMPDSYNVKGILRQEMNAVTGISDPNLGGQGGKGTTATQNLREERGFQIRIDEVENKVHRTASRTAEKMASLVTSLYTTRDVVRVTGAQGVSFQAYIGVALAGRYRFSVEMHSTSPNSQAIRRKQILDALQIFANFPDVVDRRELVLRALRQFPELGRDLSSLVVTPESARQQAMRMMASNPELLQQMLMSQVGIGAGGAGGGAGGQASRSSNVGTGVNIRGGDSSDQASQAMRLTA